MSTSFGIHKSDPPITQIPIRIVADEEADFVGDDEMRPMGGEMSRDNDGDTEIPISTFGRTTTFDVMPLPPTANGPRPLRIPQPPQPNNLLRYRHCATPSTSSLNSTTTFPAMAQPPSTSSLPVFLQQNSPAVVRRSQPSISNSTLPSYEAVMSGTSTLPNRRLHPNIELNRQHHNGSFTGLSYNELMEVASRQPMRVDTPEMAERIRLQEAQHRRHGIIMPNENERIRTPVQQQHIHLHQQQPLPIQTHSIQKHPLPPLPRPMNGQNEAEFQRLNAVFADKEMQYRQAVSQVKVLRDQMELLQQRRADAANAARVHQRCLNQKGMNNGIRAEDLYGQVMKPVRPKASVGPFQVQPNGMPSPQLASKPPLPSYDEVDTIKNQAHFGRIPVRPVDPHKYAVYKPTVSAENPWVLRAAQPVDTFVVRNDSLKAAKRRSWAHADQMHHNPQIVGKVAENVAKFQQNIAQNQLAGPKHRPAVVKVAAQPVVAMPTLKSVAEETTQPPPQRKPEEKKPKKNLLSLFTRKKDSNKEKSKSKNAEAPAKPEAPFVLANEHFVEEPEHYEERLIEYPPAKKAEEPTVAEMKAVIDEEPLPDPPTASVVPQQSQKPSNIVAPLSPPKKAPQLDDQFAQSIVIETDTEAEEPPREASASPPEDPKSHSDSGDPTAEENRNKEAEMLAATSEVMKQLDSLAFSTTPMGIPPKAEMEEDLDDEAEELEDEEDELLEGEILMSVDDGVLIQPYQLEDEPQTTTEETNSSNGDVSSNAEEEPQFDEIMRPTLKSILKAPGDSGKPKKKMIFDPLVIFLDAALEGQLELVRENAAKIADISQANEEGITALHNAICAGHCEIVKYLVTEHADVNAPDSDGWTPLHCAASCNNLPSAKLLIENGACVYATSVSDAETPRQKCEESIDGYDNCAAYLETAGKCMGLINDGKVYAVFPYHGQHEDELSFEEGDELRVLSRETGERGYFDSNTEHAYMYGMHLPPRDNDCLWWMCERLSDGRKGLSPRNYLSLYPTWRTAQQCDFKHFELPSNAVAFEALLRQHQPPQTTTVAMSVTSTTDSNATLDACDEGSSTSSASPDSAVARDDDSPPPLPKPEFDANVQISAHA